MDHLVSTTFALAFAFALSSALALATVALWSRRGAARRLVASTCVSAVGGVQAAVALVGEGAINRATARNGGAARSCLELFAEGEFAAVVRVLAVFHHVRLRKVSRPLLAA